QQAIELIQAVEQADSSESLKEAVEALANARLEQGIPLLIAALSYNNPGAAVASVEGLVQLGELAVLPLLNLIDDYNYGGRAWAIRALAGIGDPRALDTLIEAAETDFAMSVRRAAARGLGNLRWSLLPVQQVKSCQQRSFKTLVLTCQDGEWVVRYASVMGLQALAQAVEQNQPDLFSQIKSGLEQIVKIESDLTVSTRAQWAASQLQNVT
ncbi:MAG: HEAT repeat domain-containing protein, partial [Coleofasciculaceae cyanobacterium]